DRFLQEQRRPVHAARGAQVGGPVRRLWPLLVVVPIAISALWLLEAAAVDDPRLGLMESMLTEQKRAQQRLKLPGFDGPYFISYTLRSTDQAEATAKFGAIFGRDREQRRQVYV